MVFSIYLITNLTNQKQYTGFTSKNPSERWIEHVTVSKNPNRHDYSYIHRAIRKYGLDNFKFEVIYQSKDKNHTLSVMESYFINEYNTIRPNGYNLTSGGEGLNDYEFTDTHKSRISAALTGKEKPYMQIVNRDPEKIRKTAEKHRGMKRTDETKAKISAIHKGKTISEEQKIKLSKKWIVIFPDGHEEEVINLKAFCIENGLDVGNLSNVAYGRAKSHKKFRCRKVEQ